MAWIEIPGSGWEYNTTPVEPPAYNLGQHRLWEKQVDGIRTVTYDEFLNYPTVLIYTETRRIGTTVQSAGELNKTYWDGVGGPPETSPLLLINNAGDRLLINNAGDFLIIG